MLDNFWNVINYGTDLILTWSEDCIISFATGDIKFKIIGNGKLLENLKSIKKTVN